MDLSIGFHVESPDALVRWGISEDELRALLPDELRLVTSGYWTAEVTSLGGMNHILGFHFRPREAGTLHELEFFRFGDADLRASFEEWQAHLETTFGLPTKIADGDEDLPYFTWQLGPAQVRHFVQYRFGPEQHVRIVRN
jgi:hypothetical protein